MYSRGVDDSCRWYRTCCASATKVYPPGCHKKKHHMGQLGTRPESPMVAETIHVQLSAGGMAAIPSWSRLYDGILCENRRALASRT